MGWRIGRVWTASLFTVLLAAFTPGGSRAQVCGAAGGDNRPPSTDCLSADEPASPRGDATVSATAASIDLVTGNKYLGETDARWPDGLAFTRHYNSRNAFSRTMGPAWSHSWDTQVVRRSAAELQVIQGDGRRRVFVRLASADGSTLYRSTDPLAGQITEPATQDASTAFIWRLPDGRELRFDSSGRLMILTDARGRRLLFDYGASSGRLQTVRNGAGIALQLSYDVRGRLASLAHPDGRQTRYEYQEQGLLARVVSADGRYRRYEYSADGLLHGLTRISDESAAVVGQFSYDDQGRAVSSRMAGQPGVQVGYRLPARGDEPGESHLTHDTDGITVYRWRYLVHEHRAMMLSASGPGCSICPPAGVVRQYDTKGRVLREAWQADGVTLQWQRDALGRVRAMRWTRRDREGTAGQSLTRRFEYLNNQGDGPLAAVFDESVAPGRERSVRWAYDSSGRPTARIESGFTPVLGSLNRRLQVRQWMPVERVTRYGYHASGPARDLLAWIDGPLPGDADRTRFEHDGKGRLVSVSLPERLSEGLEYDAFGRIVAWRDADGLTTRQSWGLNGIPSRIERAGVVSEWRADADGSHWLSLQGRTVLGVHADAAGRVQALTDAEGRRQTVPPRAVPSPGHPPFALAGGKQTEFRDALGAVTRQWRNDFDELVAESSPQRGYTIIHRDTAGRMVLRAHESGALELFRYDALGRLVAKGDGANPEAVKYRWSGTRLRSVSDPIQTIAYRHDPLGRLSAEAVMIGPRESLAAQPVSALVTQFQRDALGRVVGQTLPGGHGLGFARDASGRILSIAVHSADGQSVMLADRMNWRVSAPGVPHLEGYQAGNGVRLGFERDTQGRTVQILASRAGMVIDRQRLNHDAQGRITGIAHNDEHFAYTYDQQGRLSGAAGPATAEGFAHDAAGNRLIHFTRAGGAPDRVEQHRHDRDGRLVSIEPIHASSSATRRFARSRRGDLGIELMSDPAGAPRVASAADSPWSTARVRGVIRGTHGRAIAAFADERLLAVYDYDARGLRVRRMTSPSPGDAHVYLHQDGLLTGIADARGQLRQWIVRSGQWPVAELSFEEGRLTHVQWLLSDHRAAPVRGFDSAGNTIWQRRLSAFGSTRADGPSVTSARLPTAQLSEGSMLRLAGHWFDPETGRHENGWRSYIPEQGRYAQPDPLGPYAGSNERAYAGGDPINRIDPFGLYEVDVHFYLTYFLARAAGVSPQRAYTVATAAQYVDDNPQTRPETAGNTRARELYHFVMDGFDPSRDA
ncbi:MAG TPA: RHS repeat-associated core domain-containing protein, partial [Burkholderiaceae bacterium]|nr:RHS repeat-associated core domain-containing protein [Burkholderiaceae bacterium]